MGFSANVNFTVKNTVISTVADKIGATHYCNFNGDVIYCRFSTTDDQESLMTFSPFGISEKGELSIIDDLYGFWNYNATILESIDTGITQLLKISES